MKIRRDFYLDKLIKRKNNGLIKRAQEIRPFRKIGDSFKKIVVTKDIVPRQYDE